MSKLSHTSNELVQMDRRLRMGRCPTSAFVKTIASGVRTTSTAGSAVVLHDTDGNSTLLKDVMSGLRSHEACDDVVDAVAAAVAETAVSFARRCSDVLFESVLTLRCERLDDANHGSIRCSCTDSLREDWW